ncbi:hypothetical protein ABVT39_002870 [Epinephelus coioides]
MRMISRCVHLPDSPLASPNPKKVCSNSQDERVSNADILNAIKELSSKFSSLETTINQYPADIGIIKDNIEGIDHQMKTAFDKVNAGVNKTAEDTRKKVFDIFSKVIPEEKNKLGFLVDTVHRIGHPSKDRSPRPVIIQFTMRTFKQRIWRASVNADVMKEKKLRLAEDLTYWERQCRKKLWPVDDKARKEGKKTAWRGPDVIIDGKRVTAETV